MHDDSLASSSDDPAGPVVTGARQVMTPHSSPAPVSPRFVYALGQIEWRFPSLGVEKEFAQAIAGANNSAGLSDRQVFNNALSSPEHRYLARQLCWVLVIEGLETYILAPRDPSDLGLLTDSVRDAYSRDDIDVVIGVRGHIAPPELCNGLSLPIVMFDQIYSFDRDTLVRSIPLPETLKDDDEERFRSTAGDLFDTIRQLADNAGAIDEHRALNYLAVRYPRIYTVTTVRHEQNYSFNGVEVRPSPLSGVRRIVDVIFSYTHRETDVTEKESVRVDVTEEFPFLVTKMGTYYDR